MSYDVEDLIGRLPRVDARPATIARVRGQAHLLLEGGRAAPGRARVRLARAYERLLEPALLVGTVVLTIAWALSRILYITG